MDKIFNAFLANPVQYAFAFFIVLITLGVFIKMVGNPVAYLIDKLFNVLPIVIKELKGEAGKAGIINIIIVFAILLLAFLVLLRPSILTVLTSESNNKSSSVLILLVAAVTFLISLRLVVYSEKATRLLKKD